MQVREDCCCIAFGKRCSCHAKESASRIRDSKDALPWTAAFLEKFEKRNHYNFSDHLPEIFYPTPEPFSQARHDYYELATTLFTESFAKQIGEWCETHHINLTGHVLCEDYLRWQTRACGSAMRSYLYMGMPGIDLISEYWVVFNTVKQCVSVAHQLGKSRRLTETYGCTGWDFPLLGHKALGDWQYAPGINFRCQHMAWYSMKGEAKRDYPASISFQSPWFAHYSHIEDYFARLGAAMVPGEEIRDILVVHPAEAVWGVHSHFGKNAESERIDADFCVLPNHGISRNVLRFGDWTKQRLPYYSGNVTYEFHFTPEDGRRYALGIDEWAGTEAELFVNGQRVRFLTAFN